MVNCKRDFFLKYWQEKRYFDITRHMVFLVKALEFSVTRLIRTPARIPTIHLISFNIGSLMSDGSFDLCIPNEFSCIYNIGDFMYIKHVYDLLSVN